MRRRAFRLGLPVLASMAVVVVAMVGSATPQQRGADPQGVTSKADPAQAKLDDALAAKVKDGATGQVPVLVATSGDTAPVKALLDGDAAATRKGRSLVIGRISVQALPKLAGQQGVVSVSLVQFKKTGQPLGDPDPLLNRRPSKAKLAALRRENASTDVPYGDAPAPKGSNFEQLKRLGVLDAKTHKFAEAWKDGFAGEGVTAAVLDGGTDWGHPDLLGTWQTWSNAQAAGGGATIPRGPAHERARVPGVAGWRVTGSSACSARSPCPRRAPSRSSGRWAGRRPGPGRGRSARAR